MGAADWGIGHEVSGVTSTGEKFAGEVFTFDEGTGIAVLRTKGDIINTHDVRVLNTEVQGGQVLGAKGGARHGQAPRGGRGEE